jgi:DNA helicase-2/ATP-dependent DNA helicase PcrA
MQKLNNEQQKAIDTVNGPILILAGAGSGKTRVLTQKIADLIINKHAAPNEILAVTFTNKAANEMKQRVAKILTQEGLNSASQVWMGTFHSVCLRILKANTTSLGLNPQFTIYDSDDQLDAVKEALKRLNLTDKKINPRSIHSFISSAKNELIGPEAYKGLVEGYFQTIVSEVYPIYQEILQSNSAVDFDDLLMLAVKLFKNNPSILAKYQDMFKYILIDEYQDTNHSQYMITKMLADKNRNICVVGDDAQSIYAFRGANIQNILNFEKDYPDATIIKLEQNYRSTKLILKASNEIILRNKNQKRKEMWTDNGEGEKISIYQARNEKDEAKWIATKAKELITSGVDPVEIAVLYRTNAQSRSLEEGLLQEGVNYKIVGGVRFYERKEIRDILAYLKILFNPVDDLSFKRIINIPRRGIGPKKIEELSTIAIQNETSIIGLLLNSTPEIRQSLGSQINDLAQMLIRLRELTQKVAVSTLINEILVATGYISWLDDGSSENEARIENIKELVSVANKYNELSPVESLEAFLNEVALLEEQTNVDPNELGDKITLMTIHASKGLEFGHVFIAGMEEGLFPHSRAYADPSEMEEERRLAYVASTRAKNKLFMTYTESRTFYGATNSNPVSRFLNDIPAELVSIEEQEYQHVSFGTFASDSMHDNIPHLNIDVKKGDLVRHAVFGVGEVKDLDDSVILVNFAGRVRELSLEYANLEKV